MTMADEKKLLTLGQDAVVQRLNSFDDVTLRRFICHGAHLLEERSRLKQAAIKALKTTAESILSKVEEEQGDG